MRPRDAPRGLEVEGDDVLNEMAQLLLPNTGLWLRVPRRSVATSSNPIALIAWDCSRQSGHKRDLFRVKDGRGRRNCQVASIPSGNRWSSPSTGFRSVHREPSHAAVLATFRQLFHAGRECAEHLEDAEPRI
jgi:hypothetical protein